jgi:hypothetical protein
MCLLLITLMAMRIFVLARQINTRLTISTIMAQQTSVDVAALPFALAAVLYPNAAQPRTYDTQER